MHYNRFYLRSAWHQLCLIIMLALGTLMLAAQCSSLSSDITRESPGVGRLKIQPSAATFLEPGQVVSLWIDPINLKTPSYIWRVSFNGQMIKEERGERFFSFVLPHQSGTCEVSLEVVDGGVTFRPTPISITVIGPVSPSSTRVPTPTHTPMPIDISSPTETPTPTNTVSSTPSPTDTPTLTATPTPSPTETSIPTPTPTETHTPTTTPTPTPYPPPVLEEPVDSVTSEGRLPPLSWNWEHELALDEYFEVRIWHDGDPYHTGIVWVKRSPFDFNLKGFPTGKYFWSIAVTRGNGVKSKGWQGMDAWEGIDPVIQLSEESEIRSFSLSINNTGDGSCDPFCP